MHLADVVSTLFAIYVLYLFACALLAYARRRDAEIQLSHVGDRVSETTRRRYADPVQAPAPSRPEAVRDPRFRRGGIAS